MKRSFLLIGMLALVATGCQKEEEKQPQLDPSDGVVFVAETERQTPTTKTVLNDEGEFVWSASDRLSIFEGSATATQYKLTSGGGTSYAEFSAVENPGGEIEGEPVLFSRSDTFDANVAFYPYTVGLTCTPAFEDATLTSCTIGGVVLPSLQNYVAGSFAEEAFAMAAITPTLEDHALRFANVCGALKLQLTGTDAITGITLVGRNNEPLAGKAVVTVYADGTKPTITMAGDAATGVQLDCGNGGTGVQLNETTPTVFVIATPPTTFEEGFTVTLTNTAGRTTELSTEKTNTIGRSKILVMPACSVTFENGSGSGEGSDLSAKGTANCYIVSKAGSYKFKATQGCSSTPVGAASLSGFEHPEGTPTQAAVVWETYGTSTAPNVGDLIKADVSYADGYVYFSTADTFTEGNALIAVKDADGVILWSWHIWLTDQPAEQVYKNNAGTMLDRNLGATSATPDDVGALGLFYQWGRKDPFMGADGITGTTFAVSSTAKTSSNRLSTTTSSATTGTMLYVTKNPTTYIRENSKNGDWLFYTDTTVDRTRWGQDMTTKTIYDPCPVGYRVPDMAVWRTAYGEAAKRSGLKYTNTGRNMADFFGTDDMIWYPLPGWANRLYGQLESVSSSARYWSVTDYVNSDRTYFVTFELVKGSSNSKDGSFNTGNGSTGMNPVYGLPVRCVKIAASKE